QGVDRALSVVHRRIGRQMQRVDEQERSLLEAARRHMRQRHDRLRGVTERLRHLDLRLRFADTRRRLQVLTQATATAMQARLQTRAQRLRLAEAKLQGLSPLNVLQRGYAIVRTPEGRVIVSTQDAPAGTDLRIRLRDGELPARVTEL
ncbi:MAG: exodeoxyribonuclease VII large subunit, partial [Bryobacteraceae bacterium]|nr:exodeoxyribonuclease VII large subunit [Bryobacteraceae bacterium]